MRITSNEIKNFINGFIKSRSNQLLTVLCKYSCSAGNFTKNRLRHGCFLRNSGGRKEESTISRGLQRIVILNSEKNLC